jgi:hypothetical protein
MTIRDGRSGKGESKAIGRDLTKTSVTFDERKKQLEWIAARTSINPSPSRDTVALQLPPRG